MPEPLAEEAWRATDADALWRRRCEHQLLSLLIRVFVLGDVTDESYLGNGLQVVRQSTVVASLLFLSSCPSKPACEQDRRRRGIGLLAMQQAMQSLTSPAGPASTQRPSVPCCRSRHAAAARADHTAAPSTSGRGAAGFLASSINIRSSRTSRCQAATPKEKQSTAATAQVEVRRGRE